MQSADRFLEMRKRDKDFARKDAPMSKEAKLRAGLQIASALKSQAGSNDSQPQSTGMGAMEGALAGAATGAMIPGAGLAGAGIGAVIGGTMGALKSRSARKAAERKEKADAEADYRSSLANIEMDKSSKINAALQNMQVAFQNSLNRKLNVRL